MTASSGEGKPGRTQRARQLRGGQPPLHGVRGRRALKLVQCQAAIPQPNQRIRQLRTAASGVRVRVRLGKPLAGAMSATCCIGCRATRQHRHVRL